MKITMQEILALELPSGYTIQQDWQARWEVVEHWLDNWQRQFSGRPIHVSSEDCSFCGLHLTRSCKFCPVFKITGEKSCVDSPYSHVEDLVLHKEEFVSYGTRGEAGYNELLLNAIEVEYRFLVEIAFEDLPIKCKKEV